MTKERFAYILTWHQQPTMEQRRECYRSSPIVYAFGYFGTASSMYSLLLSFKQKGRINSNVTFINDLCFIRKPQWVIIVPKDGGWKRTINQSWYEN